MTSRIILPLNRQNVRRPPMRGYEVCMLSIASIALVVIAVTSLFIINNRFGYGEENSREVDAILWISSVQNIYLLCILPFCTKNKKILISSLIPYFTLLILSTNIFIINNVRPFTKVFAVYHFTNLVANYTLVTIACNICMHNLCKKSEVTPTEQEYIVHYNVLPNASKMVNMEIVNEVCSVCMEQITKDETNVKTHCGHTFHKACIDRWFSFNNNDCPNCRNVIVQV